MEFRNVRDVRQHPADPTRYEVTLDLKAGDKWLTVPFAATPGGGGICNKVLAAIASGQYLGEIGVFEPPPTPISHEIPLSPAQWLYGLERHGLYAPLDAAIAAVVDAPRRAGLRSDVFGRKSYHYADVIAMIANNQDVLPPEIAALTPSQVQTMWATTRTERPE